MLIQDSVPDFMPGRMMTDRNNQWFAMWLEQLPGSLAVDDFLDLTNDFLGLRITAMGHQPARTLWNKVADENDDYSKQSAEDEGESPAKVGREQLSVEQDNRCRGPCRCTNPVGCIDDEIDVTAHARWNQLVDGGVDSRVLSTNSHPGDRAKDCEAPEVPAESGRARREQIHQQRNRE